MGLLDYYRQFDDVDQEEVNRELRARRARERELALAEVPTIDLSSTEWPDLPSSEVMNAAIAAARGAVNSYPDRHAEAIRRELAARHRVEPEQIAVGNGAAELLQAAALVLLTLDPEEAPAFAEEHGLSVEELPESGAMRAEIQKTIDAVNARLARVEQIKKFVILPHDLSQETGELTPTLKVKRGVVVDKYAGVIQALYDGASG